MKTVGVILASGIGERVGSRIPKQFMKVHGRLVIDFVIDAFREAKMPIVVTLPPNYEHDIKLPHDVETIRGGYTRTETVRNTFAILEQMKADYVIYHDSARPLITPQVLLAVQDKLFSGADALITAVKITDSLMNMGDLGFVVEDRSKFRCLQTPEAFCVSRLVDAYENLSEQPTLIASPMIGDPTLCVFESDLYNFKITYPDDIRIAEKLLSGDPIMPSCQVDLSMLSGRKVAVFGSTGGIGSVLVEALRSLGSNVFAYSRQDADLSSDNWEIPHGYPFDHIVYAAGLCHADKDASSKDRNDMFAVNVHSVEKLLSMAPRVLKRDGSILVVGSSASTKGRSGFSLYSSSKSAVNAVVQSHAHDLLAHHGIRVNCLCPTKTKTKMVLITMSERDEGYVLDIEEVVDAILRGLLLQSSGQIWHMYKGLRSM